MKEKSYTNAKVKTIDLGYMLQKLTNYNVVVNKLLT